MHSERPGFDQIEIAVAALFVEMARLDGAFSTLERQTIGRVLHERFGHARNECQGLLRVAERRNDEVWHDWLFTNALRMGFDQQQRVETIKGLWEVAYADKNPHRLQELMIGRIARALSLPAEVPEMTRKCAVAKARKCAFRILLPDLPLVQAQRASLEAMLADHERRLGGSLDGCACMLQESSKVLLAVQLFHAQRYESHRVRGLSPRDAIHRMEWKLLRSTRASRVAGYLGASFCMQPWCCNAARCPEREANGVAVKNPVIGFASPD